MSHRLFLNRLCNRTALSLLLCRAVLLKKYSSFTKELITLTASQKEAVFLQEIKCFENQNF